jgi:hypothetical protein
MPMKACRQNKSIGHLPRKIDLGMKGDNSTLFKWALAWLVNGTIRDVSCSFASMWKFQNWLLISGL